MWSLYLSFKGLKLPWSFPTHKPDSISLLGPCGSHFLVLLGSLPTQPYGLNFFSSLATYVYMNGTLDFVHSGLDSVICRLVVGVEVVITACAEVRPDGHLPG